jgi:hypothetical protein
MERLPEVTPTPSLMQAIESATGPKYEVRTAAQRAVDVQRYEAKYARERRVNGTMTARHLKAKAAFDTFFGYDIHAAFDADTGTWIEERDPWLRFHATLFEFLRGHTKAAVEAAAAAAAGGAAAAADQLPTAEDLRALATALVRVAREDLAGAGRDPVLLDDSFQQAALEYVDTLAAMYILPKESAAASKEAVEDEEDEDAAAAAADNNNAMEE